MLFLDVIFYVLAGISMALTLLIKKATDILFILFIVFLVAGFVTGLLFKKRKAQRAADKAKFNQLFDEYEKGNHSVLVELGRCYEKGIGTRKDLTEAFACYKEAAEEGDAKGQFRLGVFYNLGFSVPIDYKKAFYWYTKSAEQGDMDAQYNLGLCYEEGEGVCKDRKKAIYWYKLSAKQGHVKAQEALRSLGEKW